MKCKVELSEAEQKTLQQMSLNHRHQDVRIRAAGVLLLGRGKKPQEVATELGVSGQSVYNWSHGWRDRGLSGLVVGHKGGRPRALSEGMVQTALAAARSELLTLKGLAERIQEVHGQALPCRLETLSAELKRAGFSYKRGRYALKKTGRSRICFENRHTPEATAACPRPTLPPDLL